MHPRAFEALGEALLHYFIDQKNYAGFEETVKYFHSIGQGNMLQRALQENPPLLKALASSYDRKENPSFSNEKILTLLWPSLSKNLPSASSIPQQQGTIVKAAKKDEGFGVLLLFHPDSHSSIIILQPSDKLCVMTSEKQDNPAYSKNGILQFCMDSLFLPSQQGNSTLFFIPPKQTSATNAV